MTLSSRIRLALILAAVIPALLIAVIIGLGVSEQVKRIEYREARTALAHFDDLKDNAIAEIRSSLRNIVESREFLMMEMEYRMRMRVDPNYHLPTASLDLIEFTDSLGKVVISGRRPALVGQRMRIPPEKGSYFKGVVSFEYQNDIKGTHPSVVVTMITDTGFLIGGIYLDGRFGELTTAVMRARIIDIDKRNQRLSDIPVELDTSRTLYRSEGALGAVLIDESGSDFRLEARFPRIERSGLFNELITAVLAVMLFSLVVVIGASLYFSAQTRRQMNSLSDGASRVASGDFSQPIIESGSGELSDLADSFNRMMRQLNEYRDRLIVSQKVAAWQTIGRKIAHEVKNPLTPIAIAADDIHRSYLEKRDDYDEILRSSSEIIKKEIVRIRKLVDEFSSFARMPAPEIKELRIEPLIEELGVLFKEESEQHRLVFRNLLGTDIILADPDQLRQVLINLVKNSLEAGATQIGITFHHDQGKTIITVEDDGPGFPDKLLREGITPYNSTKEGGSGLGLVICQRIVYDHDGNLKLENINKGGAGGARVVVELPYKHG